MIPAGLCQCGCGQRTLLARRDDYRRGRRKGKPLRFIQGHNLGPGPRRLDPPDPTAPASARRCRMCGYPMTPQRTSPPLGWRRHGGRELCDVHLVLAYRTDMALDYPRTNHRRDEVLDEWARWRPEGWTRVEMAEWLGMKLESFERMLYRARRAGDPRAVLGKRGVTESRSEVA